VERVIDGDTVRVRHLPGYNWRRWKHPSPLTSRGIADQTLSIRIYGVDCPELAKFGKPSQPYGPEAKEHTTRIVLHRVVRITLLRKDQYRRAVAQVHTVPSRFFSWIPLDLFRPKDVSVELATAGLAELYTGGGAEYCVRTLTVEGTPLSLSPNPNRLTPYCM
jgi:endonuclease YncB( thermonuclease family)